MSGDSQKLLELAAMVEKATGPDWDLDRLIINAVFPEVQVGGVPRYTASLDAALTLVPANHQWSIESEEVRLDGDVIRPCAYVNAFGVDVHISDGIFATTPALALCAAALRARASALGQD